MHVSRALSHAVHAQDGDVCAQCFAQPASSANALAGATGRGTSYQKARAASPSPPARIAIPHLRPRPVVQPLRVVVAVESKADFLRMLSAAHRPMPPLFPHARHEPNRIRHRSLSSALSSSSAVGSFGSKKGGSSSVPYPARLATRSTIATASSKMVKRA